LRANNLIFLNHASFAIEGDKELLLIDPWFEGTAFYNGWSLLDTQSSNINVIAWLKSLRKRVCLWYSHEHSDHFSISFLKSLKLAGLHPTIIFQKTLDGRVADFLRKQRFDVIEADAGNEISLNSELSITTWPYAGGDSLCLIKSRGITVLNLNDCVIKTEEEAQRVKAKISTVAQKIDILMTQFGYANWIGNEEDIKAREDLAAHKFDRIAIQNDSLNPSVIIPFASFVYFCHKENFYLNDQQNTPETLRKSRRLNLIQSKIFFMKSWDQINLDLSESIADQLAETSAEAEAHWTQLKKSVRPLSFDSKLFDLSDIKSGFNRYRIRLSSNFLLLPQLFELLGFIKPVNVLITDLNKTVSLSYITGMKATTHDSWQISLSSDVFMFSLKNDFGFNTTQVNGRFRLKEMNKGGEVFKFASPQEYLKNGFGITHPITSAKKLISYLTKRILRPTPPQP
jgi:UDP-MurNAc hydroxylase